MIARQLFRGDEAATMDFVSKLGPESNMFVLSNLAITGGFQTESEFANNPQPSQVGQGNYWGSFIDGEMVGLIVFFWTGNLFIQCPNMEALPALFDEARKSNPSVDGFTGNVEQVDACLKICGFEPSSDIWAMNCEDILMSVETSNSILPELISSMPTLQAVLPTSEHEPLLREWLIEFSKEALGQNEPNMSQIKQRISGYTNGANARPKAWLLFDSEGNPVSLAGISCRAEGIIQVGPVYTPKEFRSKGYARQLIARLLLNEHQQAWSSKAVLFADDPFAIRCYEAVGFRQIGLFRIAMLQNEIILSL